MKKQKNNYLIFGTELMMIFFMLIYITASAQWLPGSNDYTLPSFLLFNYSTTVHLVIIPVIFIAWILMRIHVRSNRKQKRKLEETIELRTQQYKAELERAEKSEKHKEEFLAHMSHEMRTPMNAVLGMTNLLLQTEMSLHQQKYLKIIKESSNNLLKMINDILDLSKIEANKIEFEHISFKLHDVINKVNDILALKAEEKKINLNFEIDERVPKILIGDSSRLYQVLVNLICNALKFTEKGFVSVRVKPETIVDKSVRLTFTVSDTGIGIRKEHLENIFESFTQAGSDITRKFGGTGLGLSICKKLIELQGGQIIVKSELGKGSEFEFELTYEIEVMRQDQKVRSFLNPAENLAIGDLNILLVEDNPFNQAVASDTLHNFNERINVDIAANGKIALEKITENEYDVVLMDVQMPEMDGIEATGHIRRNNIEKKKNVPIIALTANANSNEEEKCRKAGMNDFVTKPFDPIDLFLKILKVKKENALRCT
jgi:signal transduction histidine kinase/ActR/RegA family two-component response regulator